jgi:general secretion pathway protein J
MRRPEGPAAAAGFTLVEILVAVAIVAIVAAIVATSLSGAVNVQAAADRRSGVTHGARTALDRVSQEVQSTFARRARPPAPPPQGQQGGQSTPAAPLPGGLFLESREIEGQPADRLRFFTFGRPFGGGEERASDQAVLEYSLVTTDDRRQWRLVRRQATRLDLAALDDAPGDIVADGVVGFDVQVHDGREWKPDWSDAAKLPHAVEIVLRLVPEPRPGANRPWGDGRVEEGSVLTYGTRVTLPLGPLASAAPAPGASPSASPSPSGSPSPGRSPTPAPSPSEELE